MSGGPFSRWERIERLFHEALELEGPERREFLKARCQGDPELRVEVESLLKANESAESFLHDAPSAVAADLWSEEEALDLIGRSIGPYRVEERIGQGGMGSVYLAVRVDGAFDKRVAVKLIRPGMATAEILRRFNAERRILASLEHPNVARILDAGSTSEGWPYFIMEHIDGIPIDSYCESEGLVAEERAELLVQVCEAVAACHRRGIVHRDIKPGNVLVERDGRAKLLDFGIAKLLSPLREDQTLAPTHGGSRVMTPAYASPEQLKDDPIGPASDVYSLGVLLFQVLAPAAGRRCDEGEAPETGASASRVTSARVRRTVRGDLRTVILKALREEPEDRYRTADALAEDLRRYLRDEPVTARPESLLRRVRRFARGRPRLVAGGLAMGALMASLAILGRVGPDAVDTLSLGQMRRLTYASGLEMSPVLSPEGDRLAYAAGTQSRMDVFVRPVASGEARNVTEGLPGFHQAPSWSPIGDRLAIHSGRQRGTTSIAQVQIIPAGGGSPRVLATFSGYSPGVSPAWAPDGERIAYVFGQDIYVQRADGGKANRLARAVWPHSLRWSPDGSLLAYVSDNPTYAFGGKPGNIAASSIWIVRLDGSEPVRVTDHVFSNVSPTWAPDGRRLLFVSDREGTHDIYSIGVDAKGQPTDAAVRLSTGLDAHTLDLSSDGEQVVYSVFTLQANIWSLPIPEGTTTSMADVEPVTEGNQAGEGLDVCRNGRWLAFDSNRNGNHDVYVRDLSRGDTLRITDHPSFDMIPAWSPDCTELAFYSFRTGNREIFVAPFGESRLPERVTRHPASDRFPHWSPDGNRLVFDSERSEGRYYDLYIVSRPGRGEPWGEPRRLTRDGGNSPRWSPDGRWIAYLREEDARIIAPDGSGDRLLVDADEVINPAFLAWSSDSRTVYFRSRTLEDLRHSFWSVPASGGEPTLVVRSDPELGSFRYEFTVDHERFYFTVPRRESDIWIAELKGLE